MKKVYSVLSILFVLLFNNLVFAEITEEMFNALNDRVRYMEEVFGKLDNYYLKVDRIEEDFNRGNVENAKDDKLSINGGQNEGNINIKEVNNRLSKLEGAVDVLKDKSILFESFGEVRRQQEYVCRYDHVFPITGDDNKCPLCGSLQKSRTYEKVFKYARRESISEMIAAAFEEEFAKRTLLGVSGTGIFQQIVSADTKEENFAEGSFDLIFIAKPLANSTFFIDIEAIGGNGPDELIGSFSGLNDDSGSLQDDDGLDRVSVREAWLETRFFNDRVSIVGGKLDLTNYFDGNAIANDETSQFITGAFVNGATLEAPDNGPGVVMFFDALKGLRLGLGLQSGDNSGLRITNEIFAIAKIDYTTKFLFGREGTYRIWGRTSGGSDDNKGFGVSLDQDISDRLTIFGRYGGNEHEQLDSEIANAWSTGLRLRSPLFSRLEDEVAVAFGMIDIAGGDYESSSEVYYKCQINDNFAITPNFQAVFDPAGVGEVDTVMVAGVRTQIEF